jgi:hypothetical protein
MLARSMWALDQAMRAIVPPTRARHSSGSAQEAAVSLNARITPGPDERERHVRAESRYCFARKGDEA